MSSNLPQKYRICDFCNYIKENEKGDLYCDNVFSLLKGEEKISPNNPICWEFELDAYKVLPENIINGLIRSKAYLPEITQNQEAEN